MDFGRLVINHQSMPIKLNAQLYCFMAKWIRMLTEKNLMKYLQIKKVIKYWLPIQT